MFRGLLARDNRRLGLRRAAVGLTMVMALALAGVVHAQQPVVSTGVIRLSGSVGAVQLDGWLHVASWVPPNPILPATFHANLPTMDVVAKDLALGRNYLAHGAGRGSLVCAPTDPCNALIAGFTLQRIPEGGNSCAPTDPCKPIPFALNLSLVINSDRTLNFDLSAASVLECGVDVC